MPLHTPEEQKKKKSPKAGSKKADTLALIGTILGSAGGLLGGPQIGDALSAPFLLGAQQAATKDKQRDLLEVLKGTAATQPLAMQLESSGFGADDDPAQVSPGQSQMPGIPVQTAQPQVGTASTGMNDIAASLGVSGVTAQPSAAPMDMSSPEFLQRLAELRPDLAEQVVASRASQKPATGGGIDEILKALRLEDAIFDRSTRQTPEEKARTQIDVAQEKAQNQALIQAEKITPKEQEKFSELNDLVFLHDEILGQLEKGVEVGFFEGLFSREAFGQAVLQRAGIIDEEQVQLIKNVGSRLMQTLRNLSGVQFSDKERQFMTSVSPNILDSPENLKRGMAANRLKIQYSRNFAAISKMRSATKSGKLLDENGNLLRPDLARRLNFDPDQLAATQQIQNRVNQTNQKMADFVTKPPTLRDYQLLKQAGLTDMVDPRIKQVLDQKLQQLQ